MVLIAASVFTKSGKALVTRQYVADMTRARLEGLLDAFPKLSYPKLDLLGQRQHTFVETDSVRYVYQPMDSIYMVLITTKASNILEDLETLRLFARLIPEYCRSNEESEIANKAFDLIFAFDEVVVLGYRESVNLAQVRTFTDMDSHEERVFNQMQIAQQKAALSLMKEKEKEIKRQEKLKKHLKSGISGAVASAKGISSAQARAEITSAIKDSNEGSGGGIFGSFKKPNLISGGGKALKLGAKSGANEDAFLQQLCAEGEKLSIGQSLKSQGISQVIEAVDKSSNGKVHFKCSEKLNASITRLGVLTSAEIQGSISLAISDSQFNTVVIKITNEMAKLPGYSDLVDDEGNIKGARIQVHPNLDKKEWQNNSVLRLKSEQKPYPVDVDVGILKWSVKVNDESIPLTCLPATTPLISECDGSYEYQKSKSQLVWSLTSIDKTNKNGTLEFSTPNGHADHFFPVNIRFVSLDSFCKITVDSVEKGQESEQVEFTSEHSLITEKYEIV
uniref:Coatomer subunit delta n=1 Tax=Meloidogyne floridensis TaxID=298350 RepID=A0A915NKS0_9BILA